MREARIGPWQTVMTVLIYMSRYNTFLEIFILMELLKGLFGLGKTLKLNTTIYLNIVPTNTL
jgi:hypothetical protein